MGKGIPAEVYRISTKRISMKFFRKKLELYLLHVLEDAGVYKCTTEGREAFMRFIETL